MNKAEFDALLRRIRTNNTSEKLDLSNQDGSDYSNTQDLGDALRENTTLKHLDFHYNRLNDSDVEHLIRGLRKNKTLKTLNLNDNYIKNKGGEALAQMLEKGENTTLIELNLKNKTTTSSFFGGNKVSQAIQNRIEVCLERNRVRAFNEFIERIRTNQLQPEEIDETGTLNVPYLNLTVTEIEILFQTITVNTNITGLKFDMYKINDDKIQAIARGLENNNTLKTLNLSGGVFEDAGISAIAKALETNNTLETLDLSDSNYVAYYPSTIRVRENSIRGRDGGFGEMVVTSVHLQDAAYDSNRKSLLNVLESGTNTTLTKIHLNASPAIAGRINACMKRNLRLADKRGTVDIELQAQVQELLAQVEELQAMALPDQIKACKAELQRLATTTVSQDDWEKVDAKFQEILQENGIAITNSADIRKKLQKMQELMAIHAQTLAELSEFKEIHGDTLAEMLQQHNEKAFKDAELDAALQKPEAFLYYHTMVKEMSQLYTAASVASTQWFDPKAGKKTKLLSTLFQAAGSVVPACSGFFNAGAKAVEYIGSKITEKELKNFANIAATPEEMNAIIKEVARRLVLKNQGKFTYDMVKKHNSKMIKAVFNGKLKDARNEEAKILTLCNAAESRDIDQPVLPRRRQNSAAVAYFAEQTGGTHLLPQMMNSFAIPQNGGDALLEIKIEQFIARNRESIFAGVSSLSSAEKADIETSLIQALYDRSKSHSGFYKALLNPKNVRNIRVELFQRIQQKFQGKKVAAMDMEKEINVMTRELSKELAKAIAPIQKQQSFQKKKSFT